MHKYVYVYVSQSKVSPETFILNTKLSMHAIHEDSHMGYCDCSESLIAAKIHLSISLDGTTEQFKFGLRKQLL